MPKPPVILIHGMGLCRLMWADFIAPLQAAGHEVITYDLLGHGYEKGNEKPAQTHVNLTLFSQQLRALMDAKGCAQAHLVGFSIGGMINRRFALDYPGRVASLHIWNSPHDRGAAAQAAVEARALAVRDEGPMATMEAALQRWFVAAPADLQQKIRDWRAACDAETYAGTAWTLANGVMELTAPTNPQACPPMC